jgi:hypothetical protein
MKPRRPSFCADLWAGHGRQYVWFTCLPRVPVIGGGEVTEVLSGKVPLLFIDLQIDDYRRNDAALLCSVEDLGSV